MTGQAAEGVTVIVAARDEAPTIAEVVRGAIAATPGLLEVLVVDDGSLDETAERAREAGARVVRLPRNQGKGSAVRRGIAEARGEVLVLLDGDGQDRPEEIAPLLEAIAGGADLVLGSRFLGSFEPGSITRANLLGTRALTALVNAVAGTRVTDPVAGFRAVRREAALRAAPTAERYDIELDLLLGVHACGGRIAEVAVTRAPRRHGRSGLRPLREGLRMAALLLRHRLRGSLPSGRGPATGR